MEQYESHIYKTMSREQAELCGYFDTDAIRLDVDALNYDPLVGSADITEDTVIGYYPGAFGSFHVGHQLVASRAYEYLSMMHPGKDVRIIIAPANADYIAHKYEQGNLLNDNAQRLHRITDALKTIDHGEHMLVDTAPMMCYTADMNFTDLCLHMLEREGLAWSDMKVKPFFIFGKDRTPYAHALSELGHNAIAIHTGDLNNVSTSKNEPLNRWEPRKKACVLRCHNMEEFALFKAFFCHHYREGTIYPILISEEIEWVKARVEEGYVHTICKDYKDIPGVQYAPVSRFFKHPLIEPNDIFYVNSDGGLFFEFQGQPKDGIVLDSDIYSGFTANRLKEKFGYDVHAFVNANPDAVDIVDIDDFRKPRYCYPFIDVAGRCSMMAWRHIDHIRYDEFRRILARMSRD